MSFWTAENVRSASGGSWLVRPAALDRTVSGLSTDTRALYPGHGFLALRGETFDGHDYLEPALAAGCPLFVIDSAAAAAPIERAAKKAGACIIRVPHTGKALLRLAAAYRRTLENTRVIAVAGSNGKTTTTRLIHAVLSSSLRGTSSAKSFNNSIGVPLTILAAAPTDQFLICEVGTNAPGEIAMLASIIEPDIAVITSIGREHLEGFDDLKGVAREEAALLSYLRPAGLAVVTADTPVEAPLTEYVKGLANVVRFGFSPHADLRASAARHELSDVFGQPGAPTLALTFRINDRTACRLPLLGEHNAANALAAFAVGRRLGIEPDKIVEALAAAKGPDMRLQPVTIPGGPDEPPLVIINDAYNANPDSMLAALHTFADIAESLAATGTAPRRRVAVLADMLELGAATAAAHQEIGERLRALRGLDAVVLVGEQMDQHARPVFAADPAWGPGRLLREPTADTSAITRIAEFLRPGDLVLLKGSRRMRLERILDARRQPKEPPPRMVS